MKLKPDELAMLNGEEGELRQEAMKFLVKLGEAYGAEEMVDIKFAFTFMFGLLADVDPKALPRVLDRRLYEDFVKEGRKVKIPSVGGLDGEDPDFWQEMGVPAEMHESYLRNSELERKLGIHHVGSCTPYMVIDMNVPALGAHIITVESSAITYFNSVLGARCERCGIASLLSAITGKYPKIGFHLDENRYATVQIDVKVPLHDIMDFGCLGQFAGELCGMDVPVFTGIDKATNPELMALSAAVATGGAVSLYHIPGITPEFRTTEEALNNKPPTITVTFGEAELKNMRARWAGTVGEKVDTVFLGCPHPNLYQLGDIAEKMRGTKKADDVLFMINVSHSTKIMGEKMHYVQDIKDTGAWLLCGTCPIISNGIPGPNYVQANPDYTTGTLVTDSVKAAVYAKSSLGARKVILGSTESCIQAGITGRWGG